MGLVGRNRRWARTRILCAVGLIAAALVAAPQRGSATIGRRPDIDSDCPMAVDDSYQAAYGTVFAVRHRGRRARQRLRAPLDEVSLEDSDTESFYGNAVVVNHRSGWFSYTPDPNTPFTGIDTFDYTIIDDAGDFDFATASIEIDPQMHNDNHSTPFQTPLTVTAPGVTANDVGAGFVDSYDHTSAHGGTVAMDDDGGFTYTPAAGFSGADSFLYTVATSVSTTSSVRSCM